MNSIKIVLQSTKAQIKITGLRVTRATKSLCQSYKKSAKRETHGELGEFIQKARPDGTDEIKDLISSAKKIGIYSTFFEKLETVVLDIDDMYDTLIEYYPMLKIAGRWIEDDDVKMVAEYIDSINRGKSNEVYYQ